MRPVIPNVAIHMNRKANDGYSWNPAVDLLPLWGSGEEKGFFRPTLAMALACREEDILATDLALYNPQEGVEWNGLLSAPRLDDLQCAFSGLTAFLAAGRAGPSPSTASFDNEEVAATPSRARRPPSCGTPWRESARPWARGRSTARRWPAASFSPATTPTPSIPTTRSSPTPTTA